MIYIYDYNLQWLYLFVAFSAIISFWPVRKMLGLLPAVTLFYMLSNSAWTWLSSINRYADVAQYDQMAVRFFSVDAIAKLLLVFGVLLFLSSNKKRFLAGGIGAAWIFCAASSAAVISQFFFFTKFCQAENTCGGILGNPSMNSSFIVVLLPVAIMRLKKIPKIVTILLAVCAVLVTKSSVAFGLLASLAATYAVFHASKRMLLFAAFASPAIMLIGYKLLGPELFNSGDRFVMWRFFLSKWNVPINWIFGTGYGTFGVFSLNMQNTFHLRSQVWWVWIHNDWLQSAFETGLVGLFLMIGTYLTGLVRLIRHKRGHETTSLILLGLMMCANYPAHLAPTAAFSCWLILTALRGYGVFPLAMDQCGTHNEIVK